MGADIEKSVHFTVFIAADKDRQPDRIHGLIVTWVRHFGGEGEHQRHPLKNQFHFRLELVGVGVAARGNRHRLGSLVGFFVFDIIEHDFGDVADLRFAVQ